MRQCVRLSSRAGQGSLTNVALKLPLNVTVRFWSVYQVLPGRSAASMI